MANLILQASDWPHKSLSGYSDKNAYCPVLLQSSSSVGACIHFPYCNQNANSFTNTLRFVLLSLCSYGFLYSGMPTPSTPKPFHLAQIQTHPLPGTFQQRPLLLSHYFRRTLFLVLTLLLTTAFYHSFHMPIFLIKNTKK